MSNIASSRITRWGITLGEYDYDIEFRPTKSHGNADMLSRLPVSANAPPSRENLMTVFQLEVLPVTAEVIRAETAGDVVLSKVLTYLQSGKWPDDIPGYLRAYYLKRHELSLENGIILWGLRVVIPKNLEKTILKELHEQHPGIVRMKGLARIHAWSPGIDSCIENLVQSCSHCAKVANSSPKGTPHSWEWPTKPMYRIHLDFFALYTVTLSLLW